MNYVILLRIVIFSLIFILVDVYAYQAFKTAVVGVNNKYLKITLTNGYWVTQAVFYIWFVIAIVFLVKNGVPSKIHYYLMNFMVLTLVPKLIIVLFLGFEDIFRLLEGVFNLFASDNKPEVFLASRRQFISRTALIIAFAPFASIFYGITKGKYNFTYHKIDLWLSDLPDAFDGFTIAQISDIHSGSFSDKEPIEKGVEMVNALNADIVVFTGDLVNNLATEIEPWISTFSKLKSKHQKLSILGNHDYADYIQWTNEQDKMQNLADLKSSHPKMGFKLLLNDSHIIEKDGQKLAFAGVENWGLPPFPQYGNLDKALENIDSETCTVLLSHDPSHWDEKVKHHSKKIALTLAGHTHGMQFGVEIPGFIKFSPVQFRYPKWAGLYTENDKNLYVNRGFGFIGFHGRVGIWPEITQITLRKKK